jgi:nucleoside-diphosphate-sugar epimerase
VLVFLTCVLFLSFSLPFSKKNSQTLNNVFFLLLPQNFFSFPSFSVDSWSVFGYYYTHNTPNVRTKTMHSAAAFAAKQPPQKQRHHQQQRCGRFRLLFRSSTTSKSRRFCGDGEEAHITYRFNDDDGKTESDEEEVSEEERTTRSAKKKKKSVCIVGGCGRIGSLIARTVLNDPERRYERVHVLTRNVNKCIAQNDTMKEENEEEGRPVRLTFGECDVTNFTAEQLLESVKGYDEVVACFGAQRISKPFDWITNAENVDERHPKSVNFWGVRKLALAAKEGGCERFVRVTGMSVGYSAFDFIAVLLNNVLSMTIKFQLLGELAIREACVANDETKSSKRMSYTIVRPGNLTDWEGIDNNSDDEKNSGGSSSSSTKSSRSSGGANNKKNNNNERVVVLTHGANHIDASKVSREDVAHIIFVALQNRKATENVTISIAGANKATAGMRSAFRWDPARGAYWETQAIDDANVQILSEWSDLDVRKFQPDEKNDLKEKAHQFWAWSFLLSAFGVAYLFLRAIFSLVRFFMLSLTSSTFAAV